MRGTLLLTNVLILSLTGAVTLNASHIAGGYMTYECLGGQEYRLMFYFYRDCFGIGAPNTATITVRDNSGNNLGTFNLPQVSVDSISEVQVNDPCMVPPNNICVIEYYYQLDTTLPYAAGGIIMYWSDQARNNGITNLQASGSAWATFPATLPDTAVYGCNSAPQFADVPPVFVCNLDTLGYSVQATDPDGDMLTYELCGVLGSGWPFPVLTYVNPYSPAYPMAANPQLAIDSLTGWMSGLPNQTGKFQIGVCIKEYRNGTLIGAYIRDFQINVVSCNPVNAHIAGTINDFDTVKICDYLSGTFTNAGYGIYHHWDFGTGNPGDTSNANPAYFNFPDTGVYLITLITGNGICLDTAYAYASVFPIQGYPNWTNYPCIGEPVNFVATVVGTPAVQYFWNFNNEGTSTQQTPSFTWNTFGVKTIWLTVWNSHGCSSTNSDYLYMLQLPTLSVTPDTILCQGDSIQLLVQSSGGPGAFTWFPSTGLSNPNIPNPMASPTSTTTYTVGLDTSAACQNTVTVTITVVGKPTVVASNDTTICPGDVAPLNAVATDTSPGLTWIWIPPVGLSSTSIPNPVANPLVTTTYTVIVINAYGCAASDVVTVTRDMSFVDAGPPLEVCYGDSLQLSATTNANAVSWQWSPATLISDPNVPVTFAQPLSSTVFTVTMTNDIGCVVDDDVQVTVNPLPPVDAGPNQETCSGNNVTLQASGALSYVWDPDPKLTCMFCSSPTVQNPTATQWFYVTGTDAKGCSSRDSVRVTVNPLPAITIIPDTFVCAGSSIQLWATGPAGAQYQWSGPPGLSCTLCANPAVAPSSISTWTVTVTDTNGCQSSSSVTVDVRPLPTVVTGPDETICLNASVSLSASGAVTYSWQPGGGTSATINVSPAVTTDYTVTGTDAWGCSNTDVVRVTVNPLPPVDAGPDQSICYGASATLQGSGANSYVWQPGGMTVPNPVVTPSLTTNYTLTGTGINGCTNTDDVTITVNPLPVVTASSSDNEICAGDVITLTAGGAVTYLWTPGGSGSVITQAPAVSATYVVTGTDANGCEDTATVFVLVHPKPPVSAGPDNHICVGDTATLTAGGASSYVWQPGAQTSASINVFPGTTTNYTVTGTDLFGCTNTDVVAVIVHGLPNVSAGADAAVCIGESHTLTASGASTYLWSNGVTGVVNTVSPTVLTTYTVVGMDIWGCSDDDDVDVDVFQLPFVSAVGDTICRGESGFLTGSGAVSYSWQPGNVFGNPGVVSPTSTTTYTVIGTDVRGCENIAVATVLVHQLPPVDAGPDRAICIGDSTQLSAGGALQFSWSPNDVSDPGIPDPVASPTGTTIYIVTGTDANGCTNTDAVEVIVNPLPPITALDDQWLYAGQCMRLTATGGVTYAWSPPTFLDDPGAQQPLACPNDTITYYVTGVDANGCINNDSVIIYAYGVPEPNIPTAFSPNGDGLNDVFRLESPKYFRMHSLTVYNRWGEKIFETSDASGGWDGTARGEPQPLGTYVFRVVGEDDVGYRVVRQGNVTLVR